MSSDDELTELLKSVWRPVPPPLEFKKSLLEELTVEAGTTERFQLQHALRPRVFLAVAVAAISGAIGYGVLLSLRVALQLIH